MAFPRAVVVVSLVAMGCSRPNPAFDETSSSETAMVTETAQETASETTMVTGAEGGTLSGDGTGEGTAGETTLVTATADGGSTTMEPPSDTGSPAGESVVVYQGPVTTGSFVGFAGQDEPDPGRLACVGEAEASFSGLCPSAVQTASLIRVSGRMLDELIARGVPTTLPIRSPTGGLIATDLETWIESGPEQPLTETPSVFSGNAVPFWTGGREPTDANCVEWTAGATKAEQPFGTIGSQHVSGSSWLPADTQSCALSFSLLCMCW